jgi:hypothetical protein
LDGKFVPHGSYGINHTKHNLEYGYLIVGLMQPSRKKNGNDDDKRKEMKEITLKLTDKEYYQYVKKGQLEYRLRIYRNESLYSIPHLS